MVLSDCCISVIGGVVSKGGYSLDWIRPMLFKKRRSSLCHTGLSKAALQALAVTGSFSFQKSVESTAPGQACTLDSTKHHSPQWQLSGLSLFLPRSKWITRLHFCITFADAVPFFWPSTTADRQPEKDPSEACCTHHGHVLLRCLTYAQPGLCLMPPSDHICANLLHSTWVTEHMHKSRTGILPASLKGEQEISICFCES